MAITRIQKWGNSYGLRIPKRILEELNIQPDTLLKIHQEEGRIVITPLQDPKTRLQELLRAITPENVHGEVDWGDGTGKAVW